MWIMRFSSARSRRFRPVAIGLLGRYPGAVMRITTMTAAGRQAARRRIPGERLERGACYSTIAWRCDSFLELARLARQPCGANHRN